MKEIVEEIVFPNTKVTDIVKFDERTKQAFRAVPDYIHPVFLFTAMQINAMGPIISDWINEHR